LGGRNRGWWELSSPKFEILKWAQTGRNRFYKLQKNKIYHKYRAGCGKRGDTVNLKAGVTAEDRAVAAAAAQQQLLPPWKRPEEEKLCRGCCKRQRAAVRLLIMIQHLGTLPASKLTRHSKPEENAAVTDEQDLKATLQVILGRQVAAPKRTHADAELAASAEQRLRADVQHQDGRDDEESTASAQVGWCVCKCMHESVAAAQI